MRRLFFDPVANRAVLDGRSRCPLWSRSGFNTYTIPSSFILVRRPSQCNLTAFPVVNGSAVEQQWICVPAGSFILRSSRERESILRHAQVRDVQATGVDAFLLPFNFMVGAFPTGRLDSRVSWGPLLLPTRATQTFGHAASDWISTTRWLDPRA